MEELIKHYNNITIGKGYSLSHEYISDEDFRQYFGDIDNKIIKYNDLDEYNINNLFENKDKDFVIILLLDTQNSGHWVTLLKNKKYIEYFDSYGEFPSYYIKQLPKKLNIQLEQYDLYLNNLLNDYLRNGYTIIYNKKKFQKLNDNINTCGKHVILRIITFLYFDMDLKEYIKYMNNIKKKWKTTYDNIVNILIPKIDD